jgi:hypothetical protein
MSCNHRWGRLEEPNPAYARRPGFQRYRLTVYPPGTSAEERRLLALVRRVPSWALPRRTRELRGRARVLLVVRMFLNGRVELNGDAHTFNRVLREFGELDERRGTGSIDAVAYELEWSHIYAGIDLARRRVTAD